MTSCCQNVKALVGYTQDDQWYVVISSSDKISCECQFSYDFCIQHPFLIDQWKNYENKFFKKVSIEWNMDIQNVFLDKTCKTIYGKLKKF